LRYIDGTVVREWDLDPGSPNGHADWPRLALLGRLRGASALRLFCPNGRMAQVESPDGADATGRLFQFKVAVRHIGAQFSQEVLAHVVGVVVGLDGQCTLFAWEPHPEPQRPDSADFAASPPGAFADAYQSWQKQHQTWRAMGGGMLVGPITDNVYGLRYQQVGRLNADNLGLADGEGR
jgi:hypothetical protein